MTKLQEYSDIFEKTRYFKNGGIKITANIDRIFTLFDELHNTENFIFRGCSEAKYKLYNSAQRCYINNELHSQVKSEAIVQHYDGFIESLIEECKNWNNSTVKNLLKASSIDEENSLAYLSYMQHFGVPTPLLDFTFNPYIALFFAIDNTNYIVSDSEIDNYFSIYYTYLDATFFEGWENAFNKNQQDLEKGIIPYSKVNKCSMHILPPNKESYKILNNTNIVNQQGLFFYNNHPFEPMEETYFAFSQRIKTDIGEEEFNKMLMLDTFANCINIHKSLIPCIKEKLKTKGMTADFLYPDTYKMKTEVVKKVMVNPLVTKNTQLP